MAKTPKLKTTSKSLHSRAARRAASPSLDLDKSLTSAPRVEENEIQRPSLLSDRANAGVSKKQAKAKPKSRSQKLRQKKGMERAEMVMDQLEIKIAKSVNRGKTVKSRRVDWDDLNRKSGSMFAALQMNTGDEDDHDDDVAVEDAMADDTMAAGSNKKPVVLGPIPSHQAAQNLAVNQHADIEVEDEIT
ncbi:hypothetical protein MPDQ_008064 [Monascus purpureus]|uniref:Alb1-domain-containing protein n=1 Tax=Monascus purpureus TaxID=5098 RepID=A0A507QUP2_MONPU|nr:hypothetical protein MPDQ_008064 [Monascus purpureus]BDD54879.1 hypothetical protein MAP00_000453 [Monascus purpureus]